MCLELSSQGADDLPVIKENLRKGFLETQTTVNKWITDFRKKFEGEDEDDDLYSSQPGASNRRQDFGPSQSQQLHGIRRSSEGVRRSGDRERYDADHRVLGDDFTALELRDEEGKITAPQFHSTRSLTHPPHSPISKAIESSIGESRPLQANASRASVWTGRRSRGAIPPAESTAITWRE